MSDVEFGGPGPITKTHDPKCPVLLWPNHAHYSTGELLACQECVENHEPCRCEWITVGRVDQDAKRLAQIEALPPRLFTYLIRGDVLAVFDE